MTNTLREKVALFWRRLKSVVSEPLFYDRLDTEEDLRDRERMLDEVEQSYYHHEGKRLGFRQD